MARVTRRTAAVALALSQLTPAAAHAEGVADWRPLTVAAAARFAIPAVWIERVMAAESGGRTHWGGQPIVSRAGAMGLMQLMPGTWSAMRARWGLGRDPHDPRDNILAGAAYLRLLYDRFGYPGLFAAYNAGPARYAAYLAGRALPYETRRYLVAVAGANTGGFPRDSLDPAAPATERGAHSLFAIPAAGDAQSGEWSTVRARERAAPGNLFVVRKPR
ncbi:lytic transglycosylase domain-containing protein [Sphingomonas sp. 1P08PE]|uniref:lytic transglycosylase domain-containing protein n=1 Tax=Sphingomonas sp. 1P08PE TaxID=554122 RepID=UPI0039A045A2